MAAVAELLNDLGHKVSGSDAVMTKLTRSLKNKGIAVFKGHDAAHVPDDATVVISSAISPENPERVQAQKMGLPILHRAQMLGQIMQAKRSVVILGSHGKTTTASLIASTLLSAGAKPSYAIGATLAATDRNAAIDSGDIFIVEGDESDASFQYLPAELVVITNIDDDHLATYDHDVQKLKAAYIDWINTQQVTCVVLNRDDAICSDISNYVKCQVLWFSRNDLSEVGFSGLRTSFVYQGQQLQLNLPGWHNLENAMATILVAQYFGLAQEAIATGLEAFKGVSRRCEIHGRVIEDYGHHPVEVKASIESILQAYPNEKVWVVFQPHRYTRTRDCWDQFVQVLKQVPNLILMDIYPASEKPIEGISSKALFEAIGHGYYLTDDELEAFMDANIESSDIILLQGAGDISNLTAIIEKSELTV